MVAGWSLRRPGFDPGHAICGGKSGTWMGFLAVPLFSLSVTLYQHSILIHSCMTSAVWAWQLTVSLNITHYMNCFSSMQRQNTVKRLKNFANLYRRSNAMEPGASIKATSSIASLDIPCIWWNPKICYHVQKILCLVPVLSHVNLVECFYLLFIQK